MVLSQINACYMNVFFERVQEIAQGCCFIDDFRYN